MQCKQFKTNPDKFKNMELDDVKNLLGLFGFNFKVQKDKLHEMPENFHEFFDVVESNFENEGYLTYIDRKYDVKEVHDEIHSFINNEVADLMAAEDDILWDIVETDQQPHMSEDAESEENEVMRDVVLFMCSWNGKEYGSRFFADGKDKEHIGKSCIGVIKHMLVAEEVVEEGKFE